MAKVQVVLGFVTTEDTGHGVYEETASEVSVIGDLVTDKKLYPDDGAILPNVSLRNSFSFVGIQALISNVQQLRYVTYLNSKWKVESIEFKTPRVIVSVKGLYNG